MHKDPIEHTLQHLNSLANSEPSLWDLLYVRDLWMQLHNYWDVFNAEIERRLGKFKPVRVLDFDLIYPAFWPAEVENPLSLEERMGFPMTASFIFRDTQTLFTLPPGSFYELSYHLNKLHGHFSSTESRLQKMTRAFRRLHLQQAPHKEQSSQTLRGIKILADMEKECEREVDALIDLGVKIEGLSGILAHPCYRPWGNIAGKAGAVADPEEVIRFWKIFEADRNHPEKDFSNYLDALNVASFYALSKERSAGKSNMSFFPLFASGTRVVLNLPRPTSSKYQYRPSLLEDIIHPVSIQYLAFATAIEMYAEHKLNRLSSVAETGLKGMQKLHRRWTRFWRDVNLRYPLAQQSDQETKSIKLTQLSDLESFSNFCRSYSDWKSSFDDVVGSIFFNVTRTDRQISENHALIKQRILDNFKEEQQSSDRPVILNEPVGEITTAFNWSRLASFVESRLVQQYKVPQNLEEITLKSLRETGLIKEAGEVFPDTEPTLRTTVLLSDVQQMLFYWERTVGHTAQLCCWQYSLNLKQLLEHICSLLTKAHCSPHSMSEATLKIYGTNLFRQLTITALVTKEQLLEIILSVTRAPIYLRIETTICTIFLDVVPPDPTTSLEIAVMYESSHLHSLVADLYQQTAILSLPSHMISSLLREFANDFPRKEPRINIFANSLKERTLLQSGSFSMVQSDVG